MVGREYLAIDQVMSLQSVVFKEIVLYESCLHLRRTMAILCVSAITRVMKEMDKVAFLGCEWRQEQRSVVVGVWTPNVSNRDNIPDTFYFHVLPFAEDVREFQFPSAISLCHRSRTNNSKRQQITWSSCLTLHHQVKRKLCSLVLHLILFWRLTLLFSTACSTNFTPFGRTGEYLWLDRTSPEASSSSSDLMLRKIPARKGTLNFEQSAMVRKHNMLRHLYCQRINRVKNMSLAPSVVILNCKQRF
ncbi:hypothetical protein HHK36_007882 [Tetracentron sinense]|uniref:Ku domain-containing protein n=1 Tax=Tetracentron sinense TaxID=13715 RepID=A0A834ZI23_TETSI|nr:hypothetical protein HHK36_007882 [Tetracentron sinense]